MNLLFDLDGTLTNPRLGIVNCIRHALTQLQAPLPTPTELTQWIGPPLQDSFLAVLGDAGLAAQAVQLYRDRFATVGLYENEVYADIPSTLATLQQQGHRARVCTSKPQVFAKQIVQHFQLSPYFVGVYGSELNGDRAHKADLIAHLLQVEGIDTQQTVMIGDRHYDIVGAQHHHLPAIGVTWGFGSTTELEHAGAHCLCHTPGELTTEVQRLHAPRHTQGGSLKSLEHQSLG